MMLALQVQYYGKLKQNEVKSCFAQVDSAHIGIVWVGQSWHCLGGSKLVLFGWVQVGIVLLLKFCWHRIGLCLFGSLKGEAVGVTYTPRCEICQEVQYRFLTSRDKKNTEEKTNFF